ncbi:MAG: 1-acyl-sn-glycerol-3-phosphate acyltransferase [Prevotellaceae bacterium]|nr:1-acyl-sn-glycerol-3-phosphate acyltransferase [Prevotellaceae bacterium]
MEDLFFNIRPYFDSEIQPMFSAILSNSEIMNSASVVVPQPAIADFVQNHKQINSKEEFQVRYMMPMLENLFKIKHATISFSGIENIEQPCIFLSNHRDIITDSAFLQYVLVKNHLHTSEIAIGNNLVAAEWMLTLMRINKSFIVYRNLLKGEQVSAFIELSAYIRHTITEKNESIWIAHRQGRAKDSNDFTQPSLLKMFALNGEGSLVNNLKQLKISPLTISYEYDPCDFLKAKEFQQLRDNENFQKNNLDDVVSMQTGALGFTGKIHYAFSPCINTELDKIESLKLPRNEEVNSIAEFIDRQIHQSYKIYPSNCIAFDKLHGEEQFINFYSKNDLEKFENYIENQISKIDLENPDRDFCRKKILEMYSNPLKNYLLANGQ